MEKVTSSTVTHNPNAFFSLVNSPLKLKGYLLQNLPAAFFSGLKVTSASADACTVSVPYKWFTRNPFRSTYFACLSMGAELSTGVLAMAQVYQRKPAVSMLVVGMEAKFFKKAKGKTLFTCNDGKQIADAINAATATGTGQEIRVQTLGLNAEGETVAEFWFTWSFKAK